jgi:redox-sensitive bicupin YhaK (pirin superfamily)
MTAGSGILHSEKNDSWRPHRADPRSKPVRFIQMWVVPDESALVPGYAQTEIDHELLSAGFVTVASGMPQHRNSAAIGIASEHAALHAARLAAGQRVQLPDAPYVHAYVAVGSVELEGAGVLHTGDAVRMTGIGGQWVTALSPAEVLVWEMDATLV